ncbi:hypothetical protein B0T26DRAFT_723883 [Lasiosphaeria miniovina]|uniref:Secreted protein n=1 Tax=Lasiosphaeria miniovina TaxID=1954250 RepID=A0AA40A6A3_9PEZI|nr:uncharacterized protein B0T26DRAFT_723883 [Lasiosphaeria miniovina]KAK0710037.1 hypothetical protein B0T26DRAFT_723883 [Lasiosphaeria miniovina]
MGGWVALQLGVGAPSIPLFLSLAYANACFSSLPCATACFPLPYARNALNLRHSLHPEYLPNYGLQWRITAVLLAIRRHLFTCILDRSKQTIQCSVNPDHVQQIQLIGSVQFHKAWRTSDPK